MSAPCWHCRHFDGMTEVSYALCNAPNSSRVRASPHTGCASFEREPGADDDPDWHPPGVSMDPIGDYYRVLEAVQQRARQRALVLGRRPGQA